MLSPCPHCGHALRSEVHRHGALRFVVYFDADERIATRAERIRSCPECGAGLLGHALVPQEHTPQ
jgi:ssDNA-binding Zn-finger/Zn-ribbon topoisomerase 1